MPSLLILKIFGRNIPVDDPRSPVVIADNVGDNIGDVSKALEDKILPYLDRIPQLLKNLSLNKLHRSVKPPIFSCFGDLALAIGENLEKYFLYAMPMLRSAAELSVQTSGADDDMKEYTNTLRNLESYSGILQVSTSNLRQSHSDNSHLEIPEAQTLYVCNRKCNGS